MVTRFHKPFAAFAVFAATSAPALASAQSSWWSRLFGPSRPPSEGGGLSVPELDPTSAAAAVTLLIGAFLLMHRARKRA